MKEQTPARDTRRSLIASVPAVHNVEKLNQRNEAENKQRAGHYKLPTYVNPKRGPLWVGFIGSLMAGRIAVGWLLYPKIESRIDPMPQSVVLFPIPD